MFSLQEGEGILHACWAFAVGAYNNLILEDVQSIDLVYIYLQNRTREAPPTATHCNNKKNLPPQFQGTTFPQPQTSPQR